MKRFNLSIIILFAVLFIAPVSVFATCPNSCHIDPSYSENCLTDAGNLSCGPNTGSGGVGVNAGAVAPYTTGIIDIINKLLVPLLFAISFITFLYGVAKTYILSNGEKAEEGHKLILWGIIGFVVMVSLWGLVNVVSGAFGLGNTGPINSWPRSRL